MEAHETDQRPPAELLARYVSSASFEQLAPAVIDRAVVLLEDHLGCALGALRLPESRPILQLAATDSGVGAALAIGAGSTSQDAAAFCNSQLANLLDFDDSYDYFMPYHPGCLIIPAALAVAEATGASGREFLTAVIVAYEVALRVGRAVGNVLWGGLPATAALDELGPAVAAAKLYGLDASQVREVFAIIAMDEEGCGQLRGRGELTYHRRIGVLKGNFGSRAQVGVWAAMKARAGLSGGAGMLEWTLAEWFRAGLPVNGFSSITASLGCEFSISRISLKPVPSCRMTHHPITAAWAALAGRTLQAHHVEHIRVLGVPRLHRTSWSSMIDAQFSVPCSLALAVSGMQPGPEWYATGAFRSPAIRELAAKVTQERSAEAELTEVRDGRFSCGVEIKLKDGRTLEGECRWIKGAPENPMTQDERRAKFATNTAHLPDEGTGLREAILRLVEMPDLRELRTQLESASAWCRSAPTGNRCHAGR